MTTSGTHTFFPDNAEILFEAFDRIGIRGTELTREKIQSARRSLNFALQEWAIKGINLWSIELVDLVLEKGIQTYNLGSDTISVLDVYINSATTKDRILTPISRSTYALIPDKTVQAPPTSFWVDRLTPIPTITLWQVPDLDDTYTLHYYRLRQLQDAAPKNGQTADVPYRFLGALTADLSERLAMKYAKDQYALMKGEAAEAWELATIDDREIAPLRLTPDLSSYLR